MSSDVIFDGTKAAAYDELDPPSPITDYGRAKADAEHAVAEAHPDGAARPHLADLRRHGHSRHERLALEAARGEGELAFFDDELRCPVAGGGPGGGRCSSWWTAASRACSTWPAAEVVSRYEFACLVAAAAGLPTERIRRASIAESGLDAAAQLRADERARGRTAAHPPARRARAAGRRRQ